MGLFSDRNKTSYSCYASKLYADTPSLMEQTVLNAIPNNRNIARDIVANLVNGILYKANRFYNYANTGSYHWGLPESKYSFNFNSSTSNVSRVLETITDGSIEITSIVVTSAIDGGTQYEVEYYVTSRGLRQGETVQWLYNTTEGLYPTLDAPEIEPISSYYPIIPIRLDNVNLGEEDGYPYLSDLRRSTKLLGIDLDDVYDAVNSQLETGDNPPESMFILMGVSVSEDSNRSNEYLYRYFADGYTRSQVTKEDFEYWETNLSDSTTSPANHIDVVAEDYHTVISWDYITKTESTESGTKGTYSLEYHNNGGRTTRSTWVQSTGGITLTYQKTGTERISYYIHGLTFKHHVLSDKWVTVDLNDAFEDPDDPTKGRVFLVPLRRDLLSAMGPIRAHDLIYESIHLFVADEYKYKVEWYQTGFGRFFITLVAVVVSVVTQQYQLGVAIWSAATVVAVIQQIIISYLLQSAAVLLEDVVGEEAALLLTTLLSIYGPGFIATGSLAAAPVSAAQLVTAGLNFATGLQSINLSNELEAITEASAELNELIEDQNEEEFNRAINTNLVRNFVSNSTYYSMDASNHVYRSIQEVRKHLLLLKTTSNFVAASQFTDRPTSPINLSV